MSRLFIALLLSFCVHAAAFFLIELMTASPRPSGGAVSKKSGFRVSLGTPRPRLENSERPVLNRPAAPKQKIDSAFPDIWPEVFIPVIQSYDGLESYLPSGDVDRRPAPESAIVVPFPKDGVLHKGKGEVVLQLYIGADGRVDYVKVESSDVSLPFQQSALDAFRFAKMIPGAKDGEPVSVKMRIVVEFEENSFD